MEYLKYNGDTNKFLDRFMVNNQNVLFLDVDGVPHYIDQMGKASRPVENYVLEIDSYLSVEGHNLIFYANPKEPNVLIVFNQSQQLERIYTVGKYGFISTDGQQQGIPSRIKSIGQVITAYKNENITF